MANNRAAFVTSGGIADALGRDVSQVRHILASRHIEHVGRAGLVRLYDPAVIERVREEAQGIDDAKRKVIPA